MICSTASACVQNNAKVASMCGCWPVEMLFWCSNKSCMVCLCSAHWLYSLSNQTIFLQQRWCMHVGITFQTGCAILRISALPNSFLPHSLSIVPTSRFAGLPPLTMVTGNHCGSCSDSMLYQLLTAAFWYNSDTLAEWAALAHLGILNKQNEFHIVRIYGWGWNLWGCPVCTHALSHALLALPFCSTCLRSETC